MSSIIPRGWPGPLRGSTAPGTRYLYGRVAFEGDFTAQQRADLLATVRAVTSGYWQPDSKWSFLRTATGVHAYQAEGWRGWLSAPTDAELCQLVSEAMRREWLRYQRWLQSVLRAGDWRGRLMYPRD